jgi:thiol-disulfide isomerase/thioredoxin
MNIDLYGVGFSSVNQYRGKYVLIDFWASWCQPCMVQMPNIRYMAQEFRDDLVVCLVGMDENRKQWWSTIKEMDLRKKDLSQTDRPYEIQHYRAYDDKKGTPLPIIKQLGIKTIPHNYLVDRSGRIIAKNISITLAIDKLKTLLEKEKQQ